MTPREAPVSFHFEDALAAELAPLVNAGALVMPGEDGKSVLRLSGREIGAAETRYGGMFGAAQNAENFLLARSLQIGEAPPRIVAAVCEGNYKAPVTGLAGAIAFSELHKRICGSAQSNDLEYDLRVALATTLQRLRAIESAKPPHALRKHYTNSASGVSKYAQGLGTSLTAVALAGSEAVLVHVGEGYAYRVVAEGQRIERISDDHTIGGTPEIREQYGDAAFANFELLQLPRFILGFCKLDEIQITRLHLDREDTILIGSSTLRRGTISDEELREILHREEPASSRDQLLRKAPFADRPDLSSTIAVVRVPQ